MSILFLNVKPVKHISHPKSMNHQFPSVSFSWKNKHVWRKNERISDTLIYDCMVGDLYLMKYHDYINVLLLQVKSEYINMYIYIYTVFLLYDVYVYPHQYSTIMYIELFINEHIYKLMRIHCWYVYIYYYIILMVNYVAINHYL
jgi:hypothetical protein